MIKLYDECFKHSAFCIGGLPFHGVTLKEASMIVNDAVERRHRIFLSTPNLDWIRISSMNREFRVATLKSDLFIADGFPIVLIGKILGVPLSERVAGSDLIESLMCMQGKPIKVFFFGGEEGAGQRAFEEVNRKGGRLIAVGHLNPGFGTIEEMSSSEIIDQINQCAPDFLIVSLGSVKGQLWIEKNKDKLNASVISHLGAVINFFAGSVKRAPLWMQRSGLEWLWRTIQEPVLLGRYLRGFAFLSKYFARVVSYKAYMVKRRIFSIKGEDAGSVEVSIDNEKMFLRFYGSFFVSDVSEVLNAISKVIDDGANVVIDLRGCEYLGPGFVGMLLRIANYCESMSIPMEFRANKRIKDELFFCGAEYLLSN